MIYIYIYIRIYNTFYFWAESQPCPTAYTPVKIKLAVESGSFEDILPLSVYQSSIFLEIIYSKSWPTLAQFDVWKKIGGWPGSKPIDLGCLKPLGL